MISKLPFRKKKWKLVLLVSIFGVILYLSIFLEGAYESYSPRKNELHISRELHFPLREISGMYLHHEDTEFQTLYSVGDHDAQIGVAQIDTEKEEIIEKTIVDFSESIINRFAVCKSPRIPGCKKLVSDMTSQWEGITADGYGNIFLLHEQLGSIFVYNADDSAIVSVINLDFFDITPDKLRKSAQSAHNEANALGEGLVLLKNGHILVARERFQRPAILEFGLEGETPQGYNPSMKMATNEAFSLKSEKVTMVPLKEWIMPKEYKQCDLSEVNWDKTGNLYIMSQKCQVIAKVKSLSTDEKRIEFEQTWSLPRKIKNPEAFVVLEDSKRFLIAEDKRSTRANNMFFLHARGELVSQR